MSPSLLKKLKITVCNKLLSLSCFMVCLQRSNEMQNYLHCWVKVKLKTRYYIPKFGRKSPFISGDTCLQTVIYIMRSTPNKSYTGIRFRFKFLANGRAGTIGVSVYKRDDTIVTFPPNQTSSSSFSSSPFSMTTHSVRQNQA